MGSPWTRIAIGLGLVLAGGCGPHVMSVPPPFEVRIVRVVRGPSVAPRDAHIRELVDDAFKSSPVFSVRSGEESIPLPGVVHVAVDRSPGRVTLALGMAFDAPESLGPLAGRGLDTEVRLERDGGELALDRDVPAAARRLVGALEAKLALLRGDEETVVGMLQSDDLNQVGLALDWIRQQRMVGLADTVADFVDHDDETIALQAIDCLAVIGTAEHAKRLVQSPRLANRVHALRVYEALARLGGPEARAFLEFAARNEDDPSLIQAVEDALRLVRRWQPRGPQPRIQRGHRR